MKSLSIFSYLKILLGSIIIFYSIKVYNSNVLYKEMLLSEIDWKIEFSKLSLIMNSVIFFLLLCAGLYFFFSERRRPKPKFR